MKKPTKPLRAGSLEQKKLEQATGGRGTCHGYYECNYCHRQTPTIFVNCPGCGRPYDGAGGGGGGGGKGK